MPFGIPGYQVRVLEEIDSLREKAEGLEGYLRYNGRNLSPQEQDLMKEQLEVMGRYINLLSQRINSWPHPFKGH